jgi:hypothetical protein
VSVAATWLFLDILYRQLVTGESVPRYIGSNQEFNYDNLQIILARSYESIE